MENSYPHFLKINDVNKGVKSYTKNTADYWNMELTKEEHLPLRKLSGRQIRFIQNIERERILKIIERLKGESEFGHYSFDVQELEDRIKQSDLKESGEWV